MNCVCGKAFSGYQSVPPLSNISMIMGTELRKDLVWVSIKTFADISNWPSELKRQQRLEKVTTVGQISQNTTPLHLHFGSGSRAGLSGWAQGPCLVWRGLQGQSQASAWVTSIALMVSAQLKILLKWFLMPSNVVRDP